MKTKNRRGPDAADRMVLLAEQLSEASKALSVMASEMRADEERRKSVKND